MRKLTTITFVSVSLHLQGTTGLNKYNLIKKKFDIPLKSFIVETKAKQKK